jgi:peptide/nickel transport system permease protein
MAIDVDDIGAREAPAAPEEPEGGQAIRTDSPLKLFVLTFAQNRLAVAGLVIIVFFLLFCYVGPLVYHTNQISTNALAANLPPSAKYPLGTDATGFNILGRLMVGGQSSIEVGLAVAVVSSIIGTIYGAISAVAGGVVDAILMRIVDGLFAIPFLLLLLILAVIFRPSLLIMIVVLSLVSWLGIARLVRGEALSLRTREFVQAVRVAGGGRWRIVVRHIVPNTIGTIMVNASLQVANAILVLATLSYLGFGIPFPAASWGSMLSNGITYLYDGYWWEIYPAGICIVLIVVAFNFIGDALRDSFDVRLQQR